MALAEPVPASATIRQALQASSATLASFAAMGVLWGAFAAMVPDTKAMLGVDDAAFGAVFLCVSSAAVVSMLLAPRIGAALGRHALPASMVALAAAFALPGQLPVFVAFCVAMAFVGATSGLVDVLANARVSTIETERGLHLMNLNHAVFSLVYAASATLTGIARTFGATPGLVLGLAATVALVLTWFARERGGHIDGLRNEPGTSQRLGLLPVLGGIVVLIAFLSENSAEAWSALHIERTLGGPTGSGSLGPALLGLTMGIGRLSGQVLVARLAEGRLLAGAALVAAAGAATAAAAPTIPVAYAGFVVLGFGVSVIAPTAFALIGRLTLPGRRARVIARAAVLGYLGFFIGPVFLGTLSQLFSLRISFGAVALILLVVLLVVPMILRRSAEG